MPGCVVLRVKAFREKKGRVKMHMDDRQARRLVDRYADMILRISYSWFNQTADAEDICQSVFLKYLTAGPRFRDAEHEKAWFIRTTINACKDTRKSAWFRHTVALEEAADMSAPAEPDSALTDAVKALPKTSRLSIYLYYYEGYAIKEIAAMLGKNESSIAAALSRGRKKLRESLRDDANGGGRR